uniref:Astacin domain-containing protein n=1 Tax=Strongyloides venezuelensis TaxID=75913 RepID=A0A0K0FHW5_STRVS
MECCIRLNVCTSTPKLCRKLEDETRPHLEDYIRNGRRIFHSVDKSQLYYNIIATKKSFPPYSTGSKRIRCYIRYDYITTYVKDALKKIEKKTCLKFKEQQSPVQMIGINFIITIMMIKLKCHIVKKKPTIVNLNRDTYILKKVTRFYSGYALGLLPEITRKDRDSNVIIFKGKISYLFEKFFKKVNNYPDSYYNTDFDFFSIMMFDSSFGSKYGGNHIFMSKFYPFYDNIISEYDEFSFNDYKR